MEDKTISFRSNLAFANKIETYVKKYFSGSGGKSEFIRTALTFYLERKEKEVCSIPEEVINTIDFLQQIIFTTNDLNVEKGMIESEVNRLWQMVQNSRS